MGGWGGGGGGSASLGCHAPSRQTPFCCRPSISTGSLLYWALQLFSPPPPTLAMMLFSSASLSELPASWRSTISMSSSLMAPSPAGAATATCVAFRNTHASELDSCTLPGAAAGRCTAPRSHASTQRDHSVPSGLTVHVVHVKHAAQLVLAAGRRPQRRHHALGAGRGRGGEGVRVGRAGKGGQIRMPASHAAAAHPVCQPVGTKLPRSPPHPARCWPPPTDDARAPPPHTTTPTPALPAPPPPTTNSLELMDSNM